MNLDLQQQRRMLQSLLQSVDAQIAAQNPKAVEASNVDHIGLSYEERVRFEAETTLAVPELRIEIGRDGTTVLSNIEYQDLRHLLTHAALYEADHEFEPTPVAADDPYRSSAVAAARENHR